APTAGRDRIALDRRGTAMKVINPATGAVIREYPDHTEAEVQKRLRHAAQAFPSWRRTTFRTQDVGGPGHIERVAGKRPSGSWDTQAWLVSKRDAHVQGGKLIPDSQGAKELFEELSSEPVHVKGDVFEAGPRRNVPEREKPTP